MSIALLALTVAACSSTSDGEPRTQPRAPAGTEGDGQRLMFWIDHREFAPLTDAELDTWKSRGVDGFVSVVQWLSGLGGRQEFSADPQTNLDGENYAYQRQLRDTQILRRAGERGMKAYLGFYFANQSGGATPLLDWFDDDGWSSVVLPRVRDLAATAKMLGFAGLAFDQELYPQADNAQKASWSAGYAGNVRSEQETRAKVQQRGQQLMNAIVEVFPDVEVVGYATSLPESWEELVQLEVNGFENSRAGNVQIDLWNGISSVPGYKSIRLLDAIFYKSTQLGDASWDTALSYDVNRAYSLLSRRWANWAYASSRIHILPFAWIDSGPSEFERARSPDYVKDQFQAFREWTTGGEIFNFAYGFKTFDYEPYVDAMLTASTPGPPDAERPTMSSPTPRQTGDRVELTGSSRDNLAIRAVRWQVTDGPSGTAEMIWEAKGGSFSSGYEWQMNWTAKNIPLKPGRNEIVVTTEDIGGLTTASTVSVTA